jgi:hypothetical protein
MDRCPDSTGPHRSANSSVKAPLPQPMSIHRKPEVLQPIKEDLAATAQTPSSAIAAPSLKLIFCSTIAEAPAALRK